VIQAAMGWEGLHLYEFRVRSARYGSPELCGGAADVTLESLRFRRNAKLTYIYDMGDWWEHEIRIEDRLEAENGRRYPRCVDGQGACPPEDCGGPEGYEAGREEAMSFEAFEDLDTMASLLKAIVLDGRHELLDDESTRWALEDAVERSHERQPFLADGFSRREVNARFREDEHRRLMHQWY
jgi:Plasmid pRiA4b ORF-3-like protein